MPSYVVTGASRGLGVRSQAGVLSWNNPRSLAFKYAYIKHLAQDPSNTVVGLVRNKSDTEKRIAKDGFKENLHIFEADIVDMKALHMAAAETAKLSGGSLDVLINNAAFVSEESNYNTIQEA